MKTKVSAMQGIPVISMKLGDVIQYKMICQPESPNVTCTAEPIAHNKFLHTSQNHLMWYVRHARCK